MSIFGCKTVSIRDAIRKYVGEDKLTSFGIGNGEDIVAGMLILHPCKNAQCVYESKKWFTVYNKSNVEIDYSGLEEYLIKHCANVMKVDVYKKVYEYFYVKCDGRCSYTASYGAFDEVVVY